MTSAEKATVFLVDDEPDVREAYCQTLRLEGIDCRGFETGGQALERLGPGFAGIVVTDIRMPGLDGMALFQRVRDIDPDLPVVIITGHGDVSLAVEAMRDGAYDFLEKPVDPERLVEVSARALDRRRLVLENRYLRHRTKPDDAMSELMIGATPAMEETRELIATLSKADVDVLITGETGAGKELAARCMHDFGPRRAGNFVALNCGALPETVLESELFGHEPGAFTDGKHRRIGKIEHADGGTLFLDEIESMPLQVQVRFLRVLQERRIERLGGNREIPVDFRVIAAAKVDLHNLVEDGTFREDLYYRLNVATVALPPLRDRLADVPLLFQNFVNLSARRLGRAAADIPVDVLLALQNHDWPGNIRELRNVAERYVLGLPLFPGRRSQDAARANAAGQANSLESQVDAFERALIERVLAAQSGRVGKAAEALGVPRKKLYLRMKKYGLDRRRYQD
ncbi:sigma-54 dependent transcriptional regulator [Pelagibius sp. CAU 1746]|uniref:sigma-54-dependent transcriptional regulator n=1 Tax=Pelagibius sp. CAU 1746 TaxID=3140370 RepID=UPI00325BB066